MPGTGGVAVGRPSSVSAIAFGWPGRLMISALPRTTATWRDRIEVGTKARPMRRICSPKPGISLVATASVASGVTSRGAGPVPPVVRTRSQRRLVDELAQGRLDRLLLVGDQPRLPLDRVQHRAAQPVAQRRDALVLVDAGRGAVADRDQADAHALAGRRERRRRQPSGIDRVLADELEQLAKGAAAALLGRAGCVLARVADERAQRCRSASACALAKRVVRRRRRSARRASARPGAGRASRARGRAGARPRPARASSTSAVRMSLPISCIWRRRASWLRIRRAGLDRVDQRFVRPSMASWSSGNSSSASPSACSSCETCFRRVLLGRSSRERGRGAAASSMAGEADRRGAEASEAARRQSAKRASLS